jgi:uncharacterized membrane protein YphA (DoxX/SURF4 family)
MGVTRGKPMTDHSLSSNLGKSVYAGAAIALGVIGLVSRDFATDWQRVGPAVPHREALALLAAICEIAGGLAVCWKRTARAGAMLLTLLYAVFVLLWVPKIFENPKVYDGWGNFFEELSLLIAGLILCAWWAPRESLLAHSEPLISRSYGICVISYALVHIIYFSGLPAWIPAWIPPGQKFWAYATTICFLAAAAAILSGILSSLAARLLTAEIAGFELLVWLPRLFKTPHVHFNWSGNGNLPGAAGSGVGGV